MLRFSSFTFGAWLCAATLSHAGDAIGFRETDLGLAGPRPLHVAIWYPARSSHHVETVGENAVFQGIEAVRNALPASGQKRALVVLSHGYGGSWRNLNWLAGALVQQGYIVAAPDHPGTTTFNKASEQAAMLWERPRDLSRVIDALAADPGLAGLVDPGRIAAIGHSLGGWTVVAQAGAKVDRSQFEAECKVNSSPRACRLRRELGLEHAGIEAEMADRRLGAIVSLDLGLARGFTAQSLASLPVPALVIAAGTDIGDMPARLESGYLAEHLPRTASTSVEIPDAMHFSFMQICKPGAAALIDAETPGDGIVCRDGGTRSREEIHREVAFLVIGFLANALPVSP